jgi:hypothetical protein
MGKARAWAEVPVFAERPHAGNRFGTQAWSSAYVDKMGFQEFKVS